MNCLSKVFLGTRMSQQFREGVLEICHTNKIDVYNAITSEIKYEVRFEQVAQNVI